MVKKGITCYLISESPVKEIIEDYFIFYKKDAEKLEPFVALEWDVDSNLRPNKIKLTYDENKLKIIHEKYNDIFKHPLIKVIKFEPNELKYLPDKMDDCEKYIINLCSDKINGNTTTYLKYPEGEKYLSKYKIAEYWKNLEGTIVRPSKKFMSTLKEQLGNIKNKSKLKIGILGCTPEVCEIIDSIFTDSDVYLIDISTDMYEGMSEFNSMRNILKKGISTNISHFIRYNWLSLDLIPLPEWKLDILIGVDVLNMLRNDTNKPDLNNQLFFNGISYITNKNSKNILTKHCVIKTLELNHYH